MSAINVIHNADAIDFMSNADEPFADLVLTSPPYNTSNPKWKRSYNSRYDVFEDSKTDDEYIEWSVDVFNAIDSVLKEDGTVLYNLSYSSRNTNLMFHTVSEIIRNTDFVIADVITWRKSNAIPNTTSPNKLTRICEYIYVFCRKSEFKTFNINKKAVSVTPSSGRKNYESILNIVEAKNNDGPNPLNKATFSTELCEKLLAIYALPGSTVFDPFIGTGTTAVAAQRLGHHFVGCELSPAQIDYAYQRLEAERRVF